MNLINRKFRLQTWNSSFTFSLVLRVLIMKMKFLKQRENQPIVAMQIRTSFTLRQRAFNRRNYTTLDHNYAVENLKAASALKSFQFSHFNYNLLVIYKWLEFFFFFFFNTCMKNLFPGLNFSLYSHTTQVFIFVKWSSCQSFNF